MNENYLEIDEKNSIENYNENSYNNDLIIFGNSISSIIENSIGKDYKNVFDMIFPIKKEKIEKKDIFQISKKISKKFKNFFEQNKFNLCINELLNSEENTEFIFNKNNINKLFIILVGIFKKIKKSEKIKNYKEFYKKVVKIYNIKKLSSIYEKYKIINNENNFINNNLNQNKNIFSFLDKYSISEDEKKIKNNFFSQKKKLYKYPNENTEKDYLIELKFLIKKFEIIKKISFILYENYNESDKNSFCFILHNHEWLFPNLIEIEINLNNKKIFKILNKINLNQIKQNLNNNNINFNLNNENLINNNKIFDIKNEINFKEENFNNEIENSFELINEEDFDEEFSITNEKIFYKKYQNFFNIIIILSFYISKIKFFFIKLNIPYLFQHEIVNSLILNKNINILNFNFFNFFLQKNIFKQIIIDFNSIDYETFDKIISFIYNNNSLGKLKISLFPKENFFSIENIFNINNNKNIFKNINFNSNNNNNIIENNETLNVKILKNNFNIFKMNLKNFFILIQQLDNLTFISLILELPSILLEINSYSMIILKFILNFFIYIFINKNLIKKNLKNKNFLQNISLITNISFDNRKFPFLNNFFKTNFKNLINYNIENLTIKAKFFELKNIINIIHFNLTYLNLGELDIQTFTSIINYVTSSEFSIKSSLTTINLSLNKTILNFND